MFSSNIDYECIQLRNNSRIQLFSKSSQNNWSNSTAFAMLIIWPNMHFHLCHIFWCTHCIHCHYPQEGFQNFIKKKSDARQTVRKNLVHTRQKILKTENFSHFYVRCWYLGTRSTCNKGSEQ